MPQSRPHQAKAARPRSSRRPVPARGPPRGSEDFPVVGTGASAGGLDACRKLVGALPAGNGMAFILIQRQASRSIEKLRGPEGEPLVRRDEMPR
jgi:two-component system, chemotaxis family, CheB/CheR fusion protein